MNTLVCLVAFFAVLCLSVVFGASVCKNNHSSITEIKCNSQDMMNSKTPCQLKKGTNATLEVKFSPDAQVANLKAVCHGIIGGVPIEFSSIDHNGCDGMNPKCPLPKGRSESYVATIEVKKIYPSLRLIIEWELQDADNQTTDVVCFLIPAQLVG